MELPGTFLAFRLPSSTTPLYCLVSPVHWQLARTVVLGCRLRCEFFLPGLYHEFGLGSTKGSPLGSTERADPQPAGDSAGPNVCLATRYRHVSPRYGADDHCFGPTRSVCSSTYGLIRLRVVVRRRITCV